MNSFTYYNPTKIIFGENTIRRIVQEIPSDAVVLMTYGGGSIKKNGVYDQVTKALKNYNLIEFGGIEANPQYSTLMKAVELCREKQVDFLLAVGGGSVIDGTKFIAAAVPFEGDPWDILAKGAKVKKAVPFGAILTLPATGSEMNAFAVVSRKEVGKKLSFGAPPLTFPRFSVLDPTVTRTLSERQRGNGVVDAFIHITEQYLTYPQDAAVQDRMAEGVLKVLIDEGPKYVKDPDDTKAAANIVWAATIALNGSLATGVVTDWATHSIGHELTVLHNIDHARTLAIVWPGMMKIMKEEKMGKLVQFAQRVWDIRTGNEQEQIEGGIRRTEEFFNSLQVPTRLSDYDLGEDTISKIIENLKDNGFTALGEQKKVTPEKVHSILSERL
jgi:NADP-dependent alcohol dehydrogenase